MALSRRAARELGQIELTKKVPAVKATRIKPSIEKLNGNKVILLKNKRTAPIKYTSRVKTKQGTTSDSVNLDKTRSKITPFTSSKKKRPVIKENDRVSLL